MSTGPTGPFRFQPAAGTLPNLPTGFTGTALVSIDDLQTAVGAPIVSSQDKYMAQFQSMFTMDPESTKTALVQWVQSGSPPMFPIWTCIVPGGGQLCSDGVFRNGLGFVLFCLNMSQDSVESTLSAMFPGITVTFALFSGVLTVAVSI